MADTEQHDLHDWDGVLGPQSEPEPMFYELTLTDDEVRLTGASPGMAFEYSRGEFEALLEDGEWVPADEDRENEVYRTPEGELPY